MYVRLVSHVIDRASRSPQGVFMASGELFERENSGGVYLDMLREVVEWFNRNLRVPPKEAFTDEWAICWFKPGHREMVSRLWRCAHALREYEIHVGILRTSRPGQVTYEDPVQVVAVPFRDSRCRGR